MPISRPDAIPIVGALVWGKNPKTILDVGVGFGLWGALFRAWTDIRLAELEPHRYNRECWQTIIDGIEIFPDYNSQLWHCYNSVFIGDALDLLGAMGKTQYEHIHLGDIIEHYEKEKGAALLCQAVKHIAPGGCVTVVTPNGYRQQGACLGNKFEQHRCGWLKSDLVKAGATHVWETANNMLVAAFQS